MNVRLCSNQVEMVTWPNEGCFKVTLSVIVQLKKKWTNCFLRGSSANQDFRSCSPVDLSSEWHAVLDV